MKFYLPGGLLKRGDVDLSDLTAAKQTGKPKWSPSEPDVLEIPMDREPSKAERAKIQRRLTTADPVEEDLYAQIADALVVMDAFAAVSKPTPKQTAEVDAAQRTAMRALIRLRLRDLRATDLT